MYNIIYNDKCITLCHRKSKQTDYELMSESSKKLNQEQISVLANLGTVRLSPLKVYERAMFKRPRLDQLALQEINSEK